MSFTGTETGLERGATKVLFVAPPKVLERGADGQYDPTIERTVNGSNVAVYPVQPAAQHRVPLRSEVVGWADVQTILDLMEASEPLSARWDPNGSAVTCVFGPRSEQTFEPIVGEHPEAAGDGSALPAVLTRYRVVLTLYVV